MQECGQRPKPPKFCLKSRVLDFAGLSALSVALPIFFALSLRLTIFVFFFLAVNFDFVLEEP